MRQVQGSENAMGKEEYQFNNGALVLIGLLGFVTGYQATHISLYLPASPCISLHPAGFVTGYQATLESSLLMSARRGNSSSSSAAVVISLLWW